MAWINGGGYGVPTSRTPSGIGINGSMMVWPGEGILKRVLTPLEIAKTVPYLEWGTPIPTTLSDEVRRRIEDQF